VWVTTAALGVRALAIWIVARRDVALWWQRLLGLSALAWDVLIVGSFVIVYYAYEPNTPLRQVIFLPVAEAALRYGIVGGLVVPFVLAPFLAFGEWLRADHYGRGFKPDAVTLPRRGISDRRGSSP
jgi:hypothetical protein